jgi:RNA polymerase sigma-70 factor (ECF subfamily)
MRAETPSQGPSAATSAEDLMAAVAERRDREAFVNLFEMFGPRVKGYLMRQGADHDTAEDLVQDVMLTAWNRASQFDRNKASVSTWVFTIARNRRIDGLRRSRRPEIDPEDPALVRKPDDPADQVVEAAQRRKHLHAAVAELPADQAKLLRLAYFEDKSHSMIAEELSLPLGTVKSRLRLAMTKLRTALENIE